MKLIRITPENASDFFGYNVIFKSRGEMLIKKILGVNKYSIKINHPDLNNTLQIKTRKIFILDTKNI